MPERPFDAELLARILSRPKPGQVWRHFASGNAYRVVSVALEEATRLPVVVYLGLESGVTWVRPVAEFLGTVADEFGNKAARFVLAEDAPSKADVWARLEAWQKVNLRRMLTAKWCDDAIWSVSLEGEGDRTLHPLVFGCDPCAKDGPELDPSILYLGDGAILEACVAAALDLWDVLHAERKEGA